MTDHPLSFDTPENNNTPNEEPKIEIPAWDQPMISEQPSFPFSSPEFLEEMPKAEPIAPIEIDAVEQVPAEPVAPKVSAPAFVPPAASADEQMPVAEQPSAVEQPPVVKPVPQAQPMPSAGNHEATPAKKPKKDRLLLRMALIAVICALLGSAIGGLSVGYYFSKQDNSADQTYRPSYSLPTTDSTPVSSTPTTTLAQIYNDAVPSIVGVTNQQTSYGYFGQTSTAVSTGTGFIISENGEILTNYHVVEGAESLTVTMYDGTILNAKLLGYEAESDVALLKVDAEGLIPVVLGDSDALYVGEQIAAIGNPLGELTYTMTVGYVSAKGRAVYTDEKPINMMQIDAAINSGNSGGPLFNLAGEVVGITTAKYSGSSNGSATIEGIGFAIPINDVLIIVDDLREYGSVQNRAYIGVTVTNSIAGGEIPEGALVQSIEKGGCGANAGLRVSDIIVAVGDTSVSSIDTLYQALRTYRAGDTAVLKVFRSGEIIELSITFDAAPEDVEIEETTEESYGFPWDYFFP